MMCGSSSPHGDATPSTLDQWEKRLSTPRQIAVERMRCLGVPIDRHGGPSRQQGAGDVEESMDGGGLPSRLVALLEEASRSWSEFVASANNEFPRICESIEVKSLHRTLSLLSRASRMDPILGEELCRAGSQPICIRLIQQINKCRAAIGKGISAEDSDALIDLQDIIFEIYSPSQAQSLAFTDDELRQRLPLVYNLTPVPQCSQSKGDAEDSKGSENDATIFIGQVTKRQSAQADVGYVMWPSAIVLSRWVLSNPHVLKGKSVLELGAGCGLVGIAAARIIAQSQSKEGQQDQSKQQVIITDVNELVLENISQNIEMDDVASIASVAKLDFYSQSGEDSGKWLAGEMNGDVESEREPVDVILAADIICQPEDAIAASKTILDALKPGGSAFVVCATSDHRFGVEIFADECQKRGLEVTEKDVAEMYDGELLSEQMDSAAGYVDGMELTFFKVIKRRNDYVALNS